MSTGVAAGLLPGLAALRRRDVPAIRGDVLAGVTVAAYLVPQVLAYAEVAGLVAVTALGRPPTCCRGGDAGDSTPSDVAGGWRTEPTPCWSPAATAWSASYPRAT